MLHVLAFITTKLGMRDAVRQEFRSNMPAVRAQEGCIEYVPVIDVPTFGPFRPSLGQTLSSLSRNGRARKHSTLMPRLRI